MGTDDNPTGKFIQDIELKEEHIDAFVTYVPRHANNNTSHKDCERGRIKRWNSGGVFVIYPHNTCRTNFSDLVWG